MKYKDFKFEVWRAANPEEWKQVEEAFIVWNTGERDRSRLWHSKLSPINIKYNLPANLFARIYLDWLDDPLK